MSECVSDFFLFMTALATVRNVKRGEGGTTKKGSQFDGSVRVRPGREGARARQTPRVRAGTCSDLSGSAPLSLFWFWVLLLRCHADVKYRARKKSLYVVGRMLQAS